MITGRDQIRAFRQQAALTLGLTSVQLKTVDMEFLGDTAIEIGRATLATGQSTPMEVKYVVVWLLSGKSILRSSICMRL